MDVDPKVIEQVSHELQAYVYLLVDPRTGVPFYAGKGRGIRHASHASEAARVPLPIDDDASVGDQGRKVAAIRELSDLGLDPEVWIVRYGLSPKEYTAVEAATIDLLMSFPIVPAVAGARLPLAARTALTNGRREDSEHGITTLQALIDTHAAPALDTDRPLLLITINGWMDFDVPEAIPGRRTRMGAGFRPEWLVTAARQNAYAEMGDSMASWWVVSEDSVRRQKIEYAVAVNRGVTRGLFRIKPESWEEIFAGQDVRGLDKVRRGFDFEIISKGPVFDEVIGAHGHRVPGRARGAQNAIYYWPRPN